MLNIPKYFSPEWTGIIDKYDEIQGKTQRNVCKANGIY